VVVDVGEVEYVDEDAAEIKLPARQFAAEYHWYE
jgi:hypothetical protein